MLDWGYGNDTEPAVSPPNRDLAVSKLMGGAVNVVLLHLENAMNKSSKLTNRLVHLENNEVRCWLFLYDSTHLYAAHTK